MNGYKIVGIPNNMSCVNGTWTGVLPYCEYQENDISLLNSPNTYNAQEAGNKFKIYTSIRPDLTKNHFSPSLVLRRFLKVTTINLMSELGVRNSSYLFSVSFF